MDREAEKRAAATAAAALVGEGMTVGLGTGSTVAQLLPAIAERRLSRVRYVATSPATAEAADRLGLAVEEFDSLSGLHLAIDGADQVDPEGWLVKGGGGAHLREKAVAAAAERFVVIADSSKPVAALQAPLPLELLAFGLAATIARLGDVRLRDAPPSPDGGLIADLSCDLSDPSRTAAELDADPGVSAHGLFAPALVSEVIVGTADGVETQAISH